MSYTDKLVARLMKLEREYSAIEDKRATLRTSTDFRYSTSAIWRELQERADTVSLCTMRTERKLIDHLKREHLKK